MKKTIFTWLTFLICAAGFALMPASAQDISVTLSVPPQVAYPAVSRRAGEEGNVLLRVVVEKTGLPRSVEVVRSSGFPRLDQAAIEAYRKARFVPYMENGEPIEVVTTGTIRFQLNRDVAPDGETLRIH